jgi:L-cysteine/cystine lyase
MVTRASFPVLREVAYLNAGSVGPLATETVEAMRAAEARGLVEGRGGLASFLRLLEARERARALIAALVHVEPEQVALTASTSDGCQVVLGGLDLGPDDEIVTTSHEHFGLLGPVHATGARVRVSELDGLDGEEALEAAIQAEIGPRTRLLALSQVLWPTGACLPVEELRRATGIPVLVDGAQSVGVLDVDGSAVDFLTVSAQKWLCGPETTGALVVRDPEALRVARPSYIGQDGYEHDGSFVPRPGAARFDTVLASASATAGLVAALEGLPPDAFERGRAAAAHCRDLLATRVDVVTPPDQAGLVAWRDSDAAATAVRLAEAGVVVRDIPGRDLVRASCGWWTSDGDVDRLLSAL